MKKTITVPPGNYILGDPCYVIPDDKWDDFCTSTKGYNHKKYTGTDGRMAMAFGTAFGDGVFYDQQGREYGVDAGMIGLVPCLWAKPRHPLDRSERVQITIKEPTKCTREVDGTLHFGNITIPTGGQ